MQFLRRTSKHLYLCLIPIATFVIGLIFTKPMFPIHLNSGVGYGPDAAYVYLFASVDMLQGYLPVFTDHPGTPLQMIIASVIPAAWLVTALRGIASAGIIDSVLQNPELYLFSVTLLLLLLTAAASYYLGIKLYSATSNAGIALSCQCAPLLFPLVSPMMAYPTAESFLQIISMLLIATLVPLFYKTAKSSNSKFEFTDLTAGVLCGLGLATKLIFLPLLGLLFIFKTWRLIALAALATALSFTAGIAPIIPKIPKMLEWYLNMAMHSDLHGLGKRELFNFAVFKRNIGYLYDMFPLFYNIFIASCVLLIAFWRTMALNSQLKVNFLIDSGILVLVALSQTAIVAKHPGLSYMMPVLPQAAFLAGYLLHTGIVLIGSDSTTKKRLADTLGLILAAVFIYIAIISTVDTYKSLQSNRMMAEASHNSIATEIAKYENPILIGTFNCSFKGCATWFGIALTRGLDLRMDSVNQSFYYYDIFSKNLRIPGQPEAPRELTRETINHLVNAGRTLLLISPKYEQNSQFKLIELVKTPNQNLYRVDGYD